jgi:hypothetical protein
MPLALTDTQRDNAQGTSTRPIIIVQIEHSGALELLSASGPVVFDSDLYSAGGLNMGGIQDGENASLSLPSTATRIAEVQNGTWRGGICKIYAIPASPDDTGEYATTDAVLLIDGLILSSAFTGSAVTVNVIQQSMTGKLTPRHTLSEVCSHIPPPGDVLTWQNSSITFESRR